MPWSCNNKCHVITTNIARQIIDANSQLTLPFVEFTDLDGSRFHLNVSDAPCLKIVIDLKDDGGLVLQKIGILLDNLAFVRNETYASDALEQVRCAALCPVPFSVQLSSNVELIVCEARAPCCSNNDGRYLMLIAFFLALLALLYFMSLLCKFWRNWYGYDCSCPVGCGYQPLNKVVAPIVSTNPQAAVIVPTVRASDLHTMVVQPIVIPSDLKVEAQPPLVFSDVLAIKTDAPPAAIAVSDIQAVTPPVLDLSDAPPVAIAVSDIQAVTLPVLDLSDAPPAAIAVSDIQAVTPPVLDLSDL